MKARSIAVLTALAASISAIACTATTDDTDGAGSAVGTTNLARGSFGLVDHELLLSLDDGPGPRTKEIVDFFVEKQVPAVFFEVGNNAKADPASSKYVADHSHLVPGGLFIGNHSLTHTTPLSSQGVAGATHEIMATDEIIGANMKAAQMQYSTQIPFFRPPYGAFTALGAAKIDQINANGAAKYVGPIFWDIGGELTATHSADWACWGKKIDIATCQAGYMKEVEDRGNRGIILVHDVHSKTIDMLKGGPGRVGMIEALRAKGFKFVGLREHEATASAFQGLPHADPAVVIRAESHPQADGSVQVQVEAANAASVIVYFDQEQTGKKFSNPATGTVTGRSFAPGSHIVRITALDAQDHTVGTQDTSFIVAAPIVGDDAANDNSACVNYDHLAQVQARGQYFNLFHKKVDCATAGAFTAEAGECYRFKGKLTVSKLPQAVGADEWAVEYDLSYDADPNDKSKLTAILKTGTGDIITGKRFAFSAPNRADVPFDNTTVDCANGIWRGVFKYATSTEEFRFSKPATATH